MDSSSQDNITSLERIPYIFIHMYEQSYGKVIMLILPVTTKDNSQSDDYCPDAAFNLSMIAHVITALSHDCTYTISNIYRLSIYSCLILDKIAYNIHSSLKNYIILLPKMYSFYYFRVITNA